MLNPVYFPHTYLSPSMADALRAFFPSVAVYQPVAGRLPDEMRSLVEKGFLEVVAPPPGDEASFDRLMRDFQQWGRLHQGGAGLKTLILHGRHLSEPIGADGGPAEIVSEIKRRIAPEPGSRGSEAALMARAFLHLAQAADRQELQIASDLARYEEARGRLLDALKGGEGPAAPEFGFWGRSDRDNHREDRLELRMVAWARLYSDHPYPSPVFVTHSQAVIRHLAENVPGRLRLSLTGLSRAVQRLAHEKRPPAGDIMAQLVALADAPLSESDLLETEEMPEAGRSSVHLWPEISPCRFFGHSLATGSRKPELPPPPLNCRSTWVVQVG